MVSTLPLNGIWSESLIASGLLIIYSTMNVDTMTEIYGRCALHYETLYDSILSSFSELRFKLLVRCYHRYSNKAFKTSTHCS